MSLNWKELELIVSEVNRSLVGGSLQKISQTDQIANGESFCLGGFSQHLGAFRLWVSLFQDKTCLCLLPPDFKVDSAKEASTFVMVLRKHLLGETIVNVEQLPHDRIALIHFANGKVLVISLIPRRGNVLLLDEWRSETRSGKSLASFQKISLKPGAIYDLPSAPANVPTAKLREELREQESLRINRIVAQIYTQNLEENHFQSLKRIWRQAHKSQSKRVATATENARRDLKQAEEAALFQWRGKVLFAKLYELGAQNLPKERTVNLEYADADGIHNVDIPLDKSKSYGQNAEGFFKKAKKFNRAFGELEEMVRALEQKTSALDALIIKLEATEDESQLKALYEEFCRLEIVVPLVLEEREKDSATAKLFLELKSSDGFRILCGRNQEENRRVTFQASKGGDIWMHLRAMPGAHVVIVSQKNKTPPLSTLLEAAQVTLYHSKIRDGRKGEVDYTFRKYVRAIKGTLAEVTYTENKTLLVEADERAYRKLIAAQNI